MGLIAKSTENSTGFTQPDVGVHEARCVKVIDLGTQKSTFEGETTWKRQVMLIWELPEQLKDGMPLTISKFYNLSLHEKSKLGADLTSWRGRAFTETEKQGFDIGNLLDVGCMLNLIEDKRGKVQVNSVMPHNKADSLRPAIHDVVLFTIEDFQQNKRESFNMLSEGIRNIILRSKELEGMNTDMGDEANDIGDVPF